MFSCISVVADVCVDSQARSWGLTVSYFYLSCCRIYKMIPVLSFHGLIVSREGKVSDVFMYFFAFSRFHPPPAAG